MPTVCLRKRKKYSKKSKQLNKIKRTAQGASKNIMPLVCARVRNHCFRGSTADQPTGNQVQEIATHGFAVTPQRTISETVSGSVAATSARA